MKRSNAAIADYEPLFRPLRKARAERSGKQAGDPKRAADAIVQIVDAEMPPVHLLLGTDALGFVRRKLESLSEEIDRWEALTISTNFAD